MNSFLVISQCYVGTLDEDVVVEADILLYLQAAPIATYHTSSN